MKKSIFAVVVAFFATVAIAADTAVIYKKGNSFSDTPSAGAQVVMTYKKEVAAPAVTVVPVSGVSAPIPVRDITNRGAAGGDNGAALAAIQAEKESQIADRKRTYRQQCLEIDQQISNLESSRSVNVDPYTGGRLEERQIRELQQKRAISC